MTTIEGSGASKVDVEVEKVDVVGRINLEELVCTAIIGGGLDLEDVPVRIEVEIEFELEVLLRREDVSGSRTRVDVSITLVVLP